MRKRLWSYDKTTIDLEDRDVSIEAVHAIDGTFIEIRFRLRSAQLRGSPENLRKTIEREASHRIQYLASFLDALE